MSEKKRTYIRYFTKEKKDKINPKNIRAYKNYLRSNIIKNQDVKETTYKTYQNYFNQFLVYLEEEWDNIYLHDEDFDFNALDIMEGFIEFCQTTLGNNKKVINTKLSAVSSYFIWAVNRDICEKHPFDKKLERMKNAKDEKLIGHHFLNDNQIDIITDTLLNEYKKETGKKYDIQDALIWSIALDSANRLGALSRVCWSKFDPEQMAFHDIREKIGKIVEVPFTQPTRDLILEWKEIRKDMDGLECDAIFIAKTNGEWHKMSSTSIYNRVRKIGKIIGIDNFRPHSIRKTQLNRVYEKTKDITMAQSLANHKSAETTLQSYVKPKSKTETLAKLNEILRKEN